MRNWLMIGNLAFCSMNVGFFAAWGHPVSIAAALLSFGMFVWILVDTN